MTTAGDRIAKHTSTGVLPRTYPRERIQKILPRMGLQSKRIRDLSDYVLVYYVIALGFLMAVSTGRVWRSLVEYCSGLGVLQTGSRQRAWRRFTRRTDALVGELLPGMLCLADRGITDFKLWWKASATGAALVCRVLSNADLAVENVLEYGFYLSRIYPSEKAKRKKRNRIVVGVIEYRLEYVEEAAPRYRMLTIILDPERARAQEVASLYCERWEVDVVLDDLKTHMRGGQIVLRSKTPELVSQEFYGMMLTHWAVGSLMNEAALRQNLSLKRLSFTHAIRVIRRKLAAMPALSP